MKKLIVTSLIMFSMLTVQGQEINWANTSKIKDSYTNSIGIKLMYIPSGSFLMGSPEDEWGRTYAEKQHKVTLTKSFLMGQCEVTQKQWQEIMGTTIQQQMKVRAEEGEILKKEKQEQRKKQAKLDKEKYKGESPEQRKKRMKAENAKRKNPYGAPKFKFSKLSEEQKMVRQEVLDEIKRMGAIYEEEKKAGNNIGLGSSHPIGAVSWTEAVAFCKKLTAREHASGKLPKGWSYRLPTEAEWEYSCRAGSSTATFFGPSPQKHIREDLETLKKAAWSQQNAIGKTHAVGQKMANAWGLHDVYGNAIEWVLDITDKFDGQARVDPLVIQGEGMRRTYRGLNAHNSGFAMRSAVRRVGGPIPPLYHFFGFRVVCAPITETTANVPDNHTNR